MDLRINGIIEDSIVDGAGLRIAVFAQGCTHACPGCHNPMTHDLNGGHLIDTSEILAMLEKNALASGITLTGGEPFLQPVPCLALARGAKALARTVWAYTGWTLDELRAMDNADITNLLSAIDVLVDGSFKLDQRSLNLKFRGSKNQRLIDMNKTGAGKIVLWSDPWDDMPY